MLNYSIKNAAKPYSTDYIYTRLRSNTSQTTSRRDVADPIIFRLQCIPRAFARWINVFFLTQVRYPNADGMFILGVNGVKEKHRVQREGMV